jgi:succinylglutamate desuccinylase
MGFHLSGLKLNHVHDFTPALLGTTLLDFLAHLGGPSVVHLPGKDHSKCRVIVTLLHGNEPSGIKAIYSLLQQGFKPQFDTKIIIASVVASLTEPVFTHRMLPGKDDLNRCFSRNQTDLQSQLAQAINQQIREYAPESVVDIHNTSGSGPAFSVSVSNSPQHQALAAHFTHRLVYTDIRLGSIMEQEFGCPVVTIEAGGAYDDEADITALKGIESYLNSHHVFTQTQDLELLLNPRRLELMTTSSIGYSTEKLNGVDITLRQDIEHFNFKRIESGTLIGWVDTQIQTHLKLDRDHMQPNDFFKVLDGKLLTKKHLTLFMVTTRADIAKSDCLFYFSE